MRTGEGAAVRLRSVERVLPDAPVVETTGAADALAELVGSGGVVALTGAGMSTESGIPDYRGADGRRRVMPMTYAEFVASPEGRRRYWARSFVAWPRFAAARPNRGHHVLSALQREGLVSDVITQNVDGLHQAAGSDRVLELHGRLDEVVCLRCGDRSSRAGLQERMREANPGFAELVHASRPSKAPLRPDGDIELSADLVASFRLLACGVCGSDALKPRVVFFGESVPKALVEHCFALVECSAGLVVLGSSLQVMSGYRFVRRASAIGLPVALVTRGATRGEAEATIRLGRLLGPILSELAVVLGVGVST